MVPIRAASVPATGSNSHSWWTPAIAMTIRSSYQATSHGVDSELASGSAMVSPGPSPCIHWRPVPAIVVDLAGVQRHAAQRVIDRVGDHDVVADARGDLGR